MLVPRPENPAPMFLRLLLSSVAIAGLFASACGGGGGGQANNAAGLEAAARDFGNALFGGDAGKAYAFLSEKCRESVSEEEFEQALAFIGVFLALFDADADDIEVDEVETRNVDGNRGEARITFRGPDQFEESFNDDSEYEEFIYEDGGWRISDCDDFEGFGDSGDDDGDGGDDDEPDRTGPGSSRDDPAPIGTTLEIGGWELTVTDVNLDAADFLASQDDFIDPPEAGEVYVLISLSATYSGNGEDDSTSFFFSFSHGAVGDSSVAYDPFQDACTFFDLPNGFDDSREVFEGGTIEGDICYSVDESDADSLLFFVEESFGFGDSDRVWFELR